MLWPGPQVWLTWILLWESELAFTLAVITQVRVGIATAPGTGRHKSHWQSLKAAHLLHGNLTPAPQILPCAWLCDEH